MRPVFVPNYLLKAFKVRSLVLNYRAYKIGYSYWQSHSLQYRDSHPKQWSAKTKSVNFQQQVTRSTAKFCS